MKTFVYTFSIIIICVFVLNFNINPDYGKTGIDKNGKLYHFSEIYGNIYSIPRVQAENYTFEDIAKISFLIYKDYSLYNSIAIDLDKGRFFTEPYDVALLKSYSADYKMNDEDISYIKTLFEEYSILVNNGNLVFNQGKNVEYIGGLYTLILQFDDGSISLTQGRADGYSEFTEKLAQFCRSKERNLTRDFTDIWLQLRLYETPENAVQTSDTITKIVYWDNMENKGLNSDFIANVKDKLLFTYDELWYFAESDNADYLMTDEEAQQIKDIAEKYDIVSWEVPTYKSKEGESDLTKYIWRLVIQFEDHSLKTLSGTDRTMVEGQIEFAEELREFRNSKVPNR